MVRACQFTNINLESIIQEANTILMSAALGSQMGCERFMDHVKQKVREAQADHDYHCQVVWTMVMHQAMEWIFGQDEQSPGDEMPTFVNGGL